MPTTLTITTSKNFGPTESYFVTLVTTNVDESFVFKSDDFSGPEMGRTFWFENREIKVEEFSGKIENGKHVVYFKASFC